jgi:gliding motility-associated-like protein
MRKLLLCLFLPFAVFTATAQCVTNVNFNTWSQAGNPGNGNWSVQGGGTQIYQSVNGNPTFFISPFDMMNVHVTGNFRTTDNDNDWMGFVFSFLKPLGASDSFDMWLFDWKKEQQDGAGSGKSLDRVNGYIPPANYTPQFWNHTNSPEFTVIQNDFGGPGWVQGFNHAFEMYLTYNRVRIIIDGVPTFDWSDCFKPGRFGFYNYSQSDCIYSNFQYELYADFAYPPQVCRGASAAFNFTNSCVNVLGQYQSMTWNFGDGTPPLVINSPTLSNVNTTHTYATAGVYTATLTVLDNNGCSTTTSHTVDVRNPIVPNPTLSPPLCNGGSNGNISLAPTGGFGNYTYQWSNATSQAILVGATAGTYAVTVTDGICNTTAQYTLSQPTALTATTSHTDAPCGSNGTATITVSGGTPPYSGVNWAGTATTSGTATSMPAGTWIADFHDANGCSALLQYTETITQLPCGYTLSASATNVSCFGGSNGTATVSVGGPGPFTYSWSPGGGNSATITNRAAGSYTYNVTDQSNGQTFTGSVNITQPGAAMVAQVTTVAISCAGANNGQAFASVPSGGVSPYNYSWSGGQPNSASVSNLGPGNICVTVSDSRSCTATACASISAVPSLTATITTVMDSCYHSGKGSATVHTSGGNPPYTFAWNNLYTDTANRNLSAGTYTVTVTDFNGCTLTASGVVNGAPPFAKTYTTQIITCYGANDGSFNINTTGGTPGYTYTWNPSSVSGNNPTGLSAGIYSFTISDAYGCTLIGTDTITSPASALSAVSSHTNVTCNGGNNGSVTITIGGGTPPYSYLGTPIPAGTNTLPNLAAGTYSGTVTDSSGCTVALSETITEPAALALSETHVNLTCNGANTGSINLTVTGGTSPYTYTWNDGVTTQNRTNIAAGTYSVTVRDVNLCSATLSVSLTQPVALTVTETHTNVQCNGASTGSITTAPAGGTIPYGFMWNDGITTQNRTNIAAGSYSLTLTDNNTCSATISVTITQPSALVVTSSHTNVTCNGANNGTLTINVSGGTAPYNFGGIPVPAGTTTIPNLPDSTYAGSIADANGCSVAVSETITEPGPQSVTVTGSNNVCFGATQGTATANFINPTGAVSYAWTGGLSGANISNLAAGTYTVTATDQNSCTQTNSITITQPAAVTMNVTTVDAACFGGNGSATANPAGGTAPYSYTWSNAATGQTVPLPAGNYTVSSSDANTCQQTASLNINQPTDITIQEVHTNVNCFGDATGAITLTVTGGTGPNYTYAWLPNVSATPSATTLIAGTYNITVTDQANCTKNTSVVITQPAAAVSATVQSQDITCFGANDGTITITAAGGSAGFTYQWNPNVSNSNTVSGLIAGNYSVTVNDVNSCSASVSATIAEPAQLVLTPSQTDLVCYQVNTGVASVTQTGGTPGFTYTWNPNVSSSNTANNLAAGSYNLTVTDNSTCTATVLFTLTEPTQLVVTETHSNVQCFGDNNGVIALSASGATPGYTYQWYPNSSTTDSATNLSAGNYHYTVTDANSCTVTQSVAITEPPQIAITAIADSATCFGQSTGSIATTVAGGTSPYSYVWNDAATTANRANIPAGNYSVTVSDLNLCSSTVAVAVYEPNELTATAVATDVSCYQYTDGQIVASALGGSPGYTFALVGGAQNTNGLFTGLSVGTYTVSVTDANTCTASASATINEPDPVVVSVTPDVIRLNLGESVQLHVNTNQSGTPTYTWQPSSGLSCNCENPVFSGNYSAVYTVSVVNDLGCSGTATVDVTVVPSYDIFIPNVFTPNGDGVNDSWKIFGNLPGIKQIQVMVFNRWGEKVFESTDINFGWDGYYKGDAVPGVYSYVAKFVWLNNHSDNDYKGTLTLLK